MRALSGIESDEALWEPLARLPVGAALRGRSLHARGIRGWRGGRLGARRWSRRRSCEAFGSWPEPPFEGALELVDAVQATVPAGFLSNMNSFQWAANYEAIPLTDAFAFRFLSFELGLVKPDAAVFEAVAAASRSPATRSSSSTTTPSTWRPRRQPASPPGTCAGVQAAREALVESRGARRLRVRRAAAQHRLGPAAAPVPTCRHGCQWPLLRLLPRLD